MSTKITPDQIQQAGATNNQILAWANAAGVWAPITSDAADLAATAYTNAAATAATLAGTAYTNAAATATTLAGTAYTNAIAIASNATNLTSGTVNTARLPAAINVATTVYVGNATVFTVANGTSFSGQANDSLAVGGSSLGTIQGQITGNAATAYANAATQAATAYTNAAAHADTIAATAYTNAAATAATLAGTAYTNAAAQAATAYTNAAAQAATAYTNAAATASTLAGTAYANAIAVAANATNLTSGTVNTARLPAAINVATTVYVGNSTVFTVANATAFSGIANNASNFNGQAASFYSNATFAASASIECIIDGGGNAITTGIKGDIEIPFACTINRVTLLADTTGNVVIDLWKAAYANYPPVVGNTITASAKPTISSNTKYQDATLTGWTTSVTSGDIIRINVDSAATITRVTLSLKVTKT